MLEVHLTDILKAMLFGCLHFEDYSKKIIMSATHSNTLFSTYTHLLVEIHIDPQPNLSDAHII